LASVQEHFMFELASVFESKNKNPHCGNLRHTRSERTVFGQNTIQRTQVRFRLVFERMEQTLRFVRESELSEKPFVGWLDHVNYFTLGTVVLYYQKPFCTWQKNVLTIFISKIFCVWGEATSNAGHSLSGIVVHIGFESENVDQRPDLKSVIIIVYVLLSVKFKNVLCSGKQKFTIRSKKVDRFENLSI